MKVIKSSQSIQVNASPSTTVWEYPLGDKDLNLAKANINGRYPDSG